MSDWISQLTDSLSYWSVALLMLLENVFPPIPSEVVMPAAGFAAERGELSFIGVVLAGSVGSLLGVTLWYYAARGLGEESLYRWIKKHGKWIGLKPEEARRAVDWFRRRGSIVVLLGRMVPGVRTLVSVPAGFAEMRIDKFLILSAVGTIGWNVALAWLGWLLGEAHQTVGEYVGWISTAIVSILIIAWLTRIARHRGWFGTSGASTSRS